MSQKLIFIIAAVILFLVAVLQFVLYSMNAGSGYETPYLVIGIVLVVAAIISIIGVLKQK